MGVRRFPDGKRVPTSRPDREAGSGNGNMGSLVCGRLTAGCRLSAPATPSPEPKRELLLLFEFSFELSTEPVRSIAAFRSPCRVVPFALSRTGW